MFEISFDVYQEHFFPIGESKYGSFSLRIRFALVSKIPESNSISESLIFELAAQILFLNGIHVFFHVLLLLLLSICVFTLIYLYLS